MKTKKIAVIGGGIVGSTAAFYLAKSGHDVDLFDDGTGQATSAAAGIISPWLSQRRNKVWYRLTANGATFYQRLLHDLKTLNLSTDFYRQNGTIVFKKSDKLLNKITLLAHERRKIDPMIGDLSVLNAEELMKRIPELNSEQAGLYAAGGALIDGQLYVQTLRQGALQFSCRIHQEKVQLLDILPHYDHVVLAVGAWLPELLQPLGYQVDVRAQKGQLFNIFLDNKQTEHYPVLMPQSEIDLLPFSNGEWVIGATHENDLGFDLTPDFTRLEEMKQEASNWIPEFSNKPLHSVRVGTRAYTSDFTPFFSALSHHDTIYVASGLGASGLTSGPYIAYLLSQLINNQPLDMDITPYNSNRYVHYCKKEHGT